MDKTLTIDDQLLKWLESKKYLPDFFRDFHAQKDIFKLINTLYDHPDENGILPVESGKVPDWVQAHGYTIEWFLWFMASRGYTLQKNKSDQNFVHFDKSLNDYNLSRGIELVTPLPGVITDKET